MEGRAHFSRSEAEALLPDIDRLLGEAQNLLAQLDQAQPQSPGAGHMNGQVHSDGRTRQAAGPAQAIQAQIEQLIGQIQARGVIVRDIRSGLVDFLSVREGKEVFLCWKRGEPLRIVWWHPTTTGITGRQRL